jgi:glycosyltransferase involved in cell wall biosynthesis
MDSSPLVSIITVTYQASAVLQQTIQSVLVQSANQFEYLVIDGGSTDGTIDILKKSESWFKQKKMTFQWQSEPDTGLYDAMNKGLKLAKGRYVWFMNAGDEISDPETLSTVFTYLTHEIDTSPDFLYGETMIIGANHQLIGPRRLKAPKKLTWKSFKLGMLVCHQSMIVKRELAPWFNLKYRYSADYDWTIRCLIASKQIVNTNRVLAYFMDGGLTNQKMGASLKERFKIMAGYFGLTSTLVSHGWFAVRAIAFKIKYGRI